MDPGFELRANLVFVTLFDGPNIAIAGVVHEYVDLTEPFMRGLQRGADLAALRAVGAHGYHPVTLPRPDYGL